MLVPEADSFPAFCAENKHLLEAFTNAVEALSLLHYQQVAALIAGDPELDRFNTLIERAAEKKQSAKCALISHRESHRC
jgi:hypothetical protein